MSATGRSTEDAPAASDVAARFRDAAFVRIVGAATGDALAASGVLARALDARDRPFQISITEFPVDADRATEADLTVAVGRTDPATDLALPAADRPASAAAFDVARELAGEESSADGARPAADTVPLALAGAVADGRAPSGSVAEAARAAGIERRPGVAVPGSDLADGLAHSTLVHAPFSGDPDAVAEALASLDLAAGEGDAVDQADLAAEDRRRLASLVALRTVGFDDVPPRGGDAVERMLRPFAGGPLGTVGGYADVLDAAARREPGTAVALALGHDVGGAALDAWRTHGRRTHDAIRAATTSRYDGVFVARADSADAPVATMGRLLHAFRSPEPVTLAVTDGAAAAVADDAETLSEAMPAAATETDGTSEVTGSSGRARFAADAADFVAAFREAR